MYVRQRLPHGAEAPSAARELVEAVAGDRVPGARLAELRLVVSELVTNAVRHGEGCGGFVELLVEVHDGVAHVEVADGGDGFDAPRAQPRPEEPGGWGLVVVDRLAVRWGVEGGPRTRVWADLPLDAFATNGHRATEPVYARNV